MKHQTNEPAKPDNSVKAVVYKENTLGLLGETFGKPSIEVLHGHVHRGGKHFTDSPLLFVDEADFRSATLADFDTYNVMWNPAYAVEEEKAA
ncbi:hypothetical protein [Vibrio parahaemolyticus]|uniref:hypothetical protein n=1 Tax=Vibrio parahaemolyticus TaxID=670 RepID=UPI003D815FBB